MSVCNGVTVWINLWIVFRGKQHMCFHHASHSNLIPTLRRRFFLFIKEPLGLSFWRKLVIWTIIEDLRCSYKKTMSTHYYKYKAQNWRRDSRPKFTDSYEKVYAHDWHTHFMWAKSLNPTSNYSLRKRLICTVEGWTFVLKGETRVNIMCAVRA